MPVTMRNAITSPVVGATAMAAFASAPTTHPIANNRRAFTRSATFSNALASVPATKPPWTAIVNQARPAPRMENSNAIAGAAAVAENQRVIPRNCPAAISASMRRGIGRLQF
jgi:hypothetical protein